MEDLKGKTVRGGLVKVFSQVGNLVLRLGSLVALARLLDPKDFGLVGMVLVITGVLSLFKDFGLPTAAVQSITITEEQKSTLFWVNMLVGGILGFLLLVMAPVLVAFYREPRLFWVTVALACTFPLSAAGGQHYAILQREMRFVAQAVIEILSLLLSTVVAIGMAIEGYGYWALVGSTIVGAVVSTACVWMSTGWFPGPPRKGIGLRPMLRFGGTVTLNGLVVYVAYNLEKVLLGRFWGANVLGLYGRAYQLVNIPTENFNAAIGGVAFASMSRLQEDPKRLTSYFLKGYSLTLGLTLPVTIGCALFADDMIFVLLGSKWQDAAMIFRLLTPTILVFALINPFAWLLISIGLVGRSLKIALVIAPLVILSYIVGLPYGPNGVALAYSSAMILWVLPHIAWCIHGTMVSFSDVLQAAGRPLLSGIVAAILAFAVQFIHGQPLSPFLRLILGGSVLLVSYLGMLLYVMRQKTFYLDLFRLLRGRSSIEEKQSVMG